MTDNIDDEFKLALFYANWCGHCKSYFLKNNNNEPLSLDEIKEKKKNKELESNKYTWQEIKDDIQSKCSILIDEYEEGELNGKYADNIDGYPTIAMLKKKGNDYVFFSKFEKNRFKTQDFLDTIQECKNMNNNDNNNNNIKETNNNDIDSEFTLALFYANWCGYCKNYFIKSNDNKPLELTEISAYKKEAEIDKNTYLWQEVKDNVKNKFNINVIDLEESDPEINSYRSAFKGWPTIFMLKKEGSELVPYKKFDKNRSDISDIHSFINKCLKNTQDGGNNMYRLKYKKYKQDYINLANKYNKLLLKYKEMN
jgi:thiol-disulfide isomerase/thioredoxin